MFGNAIGKLDLEINDTGATWVSLFDVTGAQGDAWFTVNVSLSAYSGMRKVRFHYDRNGVGTFQGDIALDVLNITQVGGNACETTGGGSCGGCAIGECGTNCSAAGCSNTTTNYTVSGWITNVTVPTGLSGLQDLFIISNYTNILRNDTQTEAISYVAADTCTCPGDASAHEFDCTDECDVAACTAGAVTFTGSGFVRCDGVWAIDSLGDPGAGCTLWIDSNCDIDE